MVVTTTTSVGARWKTHSGTLQEVLDALDSSGGRNRAVSMFHDGTVYVALVKAVE